MHSFEHDEHFLHVDKINFKSIRVDLGPFLPSAAIDIVVGYCVRPSLCPSVRPSVRPERRSHSNSLRISAISLNFGRMMHSNIQQIAIWNVYAQSIFVRSTELWNFQNRLGPGPTDDVTLSTL